MVESMRMTMAVTIDIRIQASTPRRTTKARRSRYRRRQRVGDLDTDKAARREAEILISFPSAPAAAIARHRLLHLIALSLQSPSTLAPATGLRVDNVYVRFTQSEGSARPPPVQKLMGSG
jgi:hypothetical protein